MVAGLSLYVFKFLRYALYFATVCNTTREDKSTDLFLKVFQNKKFIQEKHVVQYLFWAVYVQIAWK